MRPEQSTIPLRWPGTDTLKAARAAIRSGMAVEIELPLEVHYALYKHLHPARAHAPSEDIDVSGGAELLGPVATVAGLQDLQQLEPAVRKARYRVRLTSPEPRLSLTPPERGQTALR
jgi:hypothetical protein